jgi:uncharacterized membrane protein YfcA
MALNGVLAGAGFVAGAMNSIAGGGTFVTLPALTFAGVPPTLANASSTVALFPGTLASSWAYRDDVRPLERVGTAGLLMLSLLGGLSGALLLLFTPERLFTRVIPWLLLAATVALASGPRLGQALRSVGLHMGRASLLVAQFVLGVYGGYFGGAVGLMMLAVWTVFARVDLKSMTPLRVLMVAAANGAAVVCFAASANIRWRETLVVMAGGIAGGYLGARAGKLLPGTVVRAAILSITIATTAVYFVRANG